MAYKLFKPRRGKKSYMDDSNIILAKGELFFETPEDGVGTGICKVKMGDGTTVYSELPYAIDSSSSSGSGTGDISSSEVIFTESETTDNNELLGEISSGNTLSNLFGSVKTLLSNLVTLIGALSDETSDISQSLSNYALKSNLTDGSVTKVGTSTVGSSTQPIYLNSGTPTASSSTVGSSTKGSYLSNGTVTACSYGQECEIYSKHVTTDFLSQPRTDITGVDSESGAFLASIRCDSAVSGMCTAYSVGIAFGRSDCQGFVWPAYASSSAKAYIGGE